MRTKQGVGGGGGGGWNGVQMKYNANGVRLFYGSSNEYFDYDQIVFATHADQTLKLIQNPSKDEKKILNSFHYKKN